MARRQRADVAMFWFSQSEWPLTLTLSHRERGPIELADDPIEPSDIPEETRANTMHGLAPIPVGEGTDRVR
ncbi:hypothetical protein D9980_18425 [Serratia sp. 3ACOL1]|nr:hypothetical protein D9980_18425 [Serratia sp. 3ACOL1]